MILVSITAPEVEGDHIPATRSTVESRRVAAMDGEGEQEEGISSSSITLPIYL